MPADLNKAPSRALTSSEGHILAVATSAALLSLLPVAAHQVGVIHHLPDPPGKVFDSDGLTQSKAAHPFGVPDGLLGIGSYGLTLALVLAARRNPALQPALGVKLLADSGAAGFNVIRQVVCFRRICTWCMATAVCTAVMAAAGRRLIGKSFGLG